MTHLMEAGNEQFRTNLAAAQALCKECVPLIAARGHLLDATYKDSVKDAQIVSKDYRLNPVDGVLERQVSITRALIWVPVMPTTVLPPECFNPPRSDLTWRRFAFECAHMTFLEPHRSSGATWQTLKRMAFWVCMLKDFNCLLYTSPSPRDS